MAKQRGPFTIDEHYSAIDQLLSAWPKDCDPYHSIGAGLSVVLIEGVSTMPITLDKTVSEIARETPSSLSR